MQPRAAPENGMRLRDRLRDETSELILAATEAVIADEGLQGAKVERIAGRAGVSVGTVYNHFEDRHALLESLFESRGSRMLELLEKWVGAARDRPVREQVHGFFQAMVEHGREHRALFDALVKEEHGPVRLRAPKFSRAALAVTAAAVVERGIASGEFRPDPHGIFVEVLVGIARQALACAVEGRGTPREIDVMTEVFVRGVAR